MQNRLYAGRFFFATMKIVPHEIWRCGMASADVKCIAKVLQKLVANPPKEVRDRMRARIEERRKGMPRGASRGELSLRVGY